MKFLFDNGLPARLAEALDLLAERGQDNIIGLRKKFKENTPDEEWIDVLVREGNWAFLTKDVRISRHRINRETWKKTGIVAFYLEGKSWEVKLIELCWRLLKYWDSIQAVASDPENRGRSFKISIHGKIKLIS